MFLLLNSIYCMDIRIIIFSSVHQFSRSVMSDSLRPHGLQHTRLPCPLLSPWICSDSYPFSRWCHPTISCCPLLFLPSIFPCIRVPSSEFSFCVRWPENWSFNFSISPSNEYWGLISFRIGWLDLLEVQVTLKSLLQHHDLKASVLWCSAFLKVQLSHLYMTAGEAVTLTILTFVAKMMSQLF